jgi:hypothetical protein
MKKQMNNKPKSLIMLEFILTTLLIFYITTTIVYAAVTSASWSWNPSVITIGENTYAFGKLTYTSLFGWWVGEIKLFVDGNLVKPTTVASQNAGWGEWYRTLDGWWYYGSGCMGGILYPGTTVDQWVKAYTTSYTSGSFYGYVRPAWQYENPYCGVFPYTPQAGGYVIVSGSGIPYASWSSNTLNVTGNS